MGIPRAVSVTESIATRDRNNGNRKQIGKDSSKIFSVVDLTRSVLFFDDEVLENLNFVRKGVLNGLEVFSFVLSNPCNACLGNNNPSCSL